MSLSKKILLIIVIIVFGLVIFFLTLSEVTKNLDSYVYDLPFKEGTNNKVVQGYGGRFSHTNEAALDFGMPEGTPVYAAREGQVYAFKDDSNEGGPFSKMITKQIILSLDMAMAALVVIGIYNKMVLLLKKGK